MSIPQDKIEILSTDLLERHKEEVRSLKSLARGLRIQLGWHYLLDLTWILENLGDPGGMQLLDAGAGVGLLQWYLVEQGAARVISVDRSDRSDLVLRFRARYKVSGLRPADLKPAPAVIRRNIQAARGTGKLAPALRGLASLLLIPLPKARPGRIVFYNQNLADMTDVPDDSLDAVVSVSALEHNTPEALPSVVAGIMRKIKPGGRLLATLGAAREKDWFHEPSQGWNYTDASLRNLFDLASEASSNYAHHDEFFAALKECAELRDHLSSFYLKSGNNGMPWGKWDPQYQPVGVCKIKTKG